MIARYGSRWGAALTVVVLGALSAGVAVTGQARAQETPSCGGRTPGIVGTPGDDVIRGTSDAEAIHGLGGNDTIYAVGGEDVVCGGRGNDHLIASESAPAELRGGPGNDHLVSSDADAGYTGYIPDLLFGGRGRDLIEGRSELNYIHPGPGRDSIDVTHDRKSWGRLFYRDAASIRVNMRRRRAWGQGTDRFVGNIVWVTGSAGDDRLVGRNGRQVLEGGAGDDLLRGRGGPDLLRGDDGTDSAHGGRGTDTCLEVERERSCEPY